MAQFTESKRVDLVISEIDKLNGSDPNLEIDSETGQECPKEILYSKRMTKVLEEFSPKASDIVRIAVHAQHIARWKMPRASFPEGRAGYLRWRTKLGQMHAEVTREIMEKTGLFEETELNRIKVLLTKQTIKKAAEARDPEVQLLEDVICLVFLKFYFGKFAEREDMTSDKAKLITIVKRTWVKMSEHAQSTALETVPELPPFLDWMQKYEQEMEDSEKEKVDSEKEKEDTTQQDSNSASETTAN